MDMLILYFIGGKGGTAVHWLRGAVTAEKCVWLRSHVLDDSLCLVNHLTATSTGHVLKTL